jgi:hypothetical protein
MRIGERKLKRNVKKAGRMDILRLLANDQLRNYDDTLLIARASPTGPWKSLFGLI